MLRAPLCINDQSNLSSFDRRPRSSDEQPTDYRIRSFNDVRLLCSSWSINGQNCSIARDNPQSNSLRLNNRFVISRSVVRLQD